VSSLYFGLKSGKRKKKNANSGEKETRGKRRAESKMQRNLHDRPPAQEKGERPYRDVATDLMPEEKVE